LNAGHFRLGDRRFLVVNQHRVVLNIHVVLVAVLAHCRCVLVIVNQHRVSLKVNLPVLRIRLVRVDLPASVRPGGRSGRRRPSG